MLEEVDIPFALGSATLTAAARSVVSALAKRALNEGASRVDVVGHADALGDAEYNLDLSRRRAEAVSDRLRQSGIGANALRVDWRGEFDPQTPAPEAAEPKNRRVNVRVFR
ncbi:OmpA family protein [Delftia lacustris]